MDLQPRIFRFNKIENLEQMIECLVSIWIDPLSFEINLCANMHCFTVPRKLISAAFVWLCEKIKYWINEGPETFTFYNWYCADFYSLLLNTRRGLKVFSLPIFQFLKSSSFSHVQCRSGLFYVFMVFEGKNGLHTLM